MNEAILVYDDDCGFCTWWADFFAARTDFRTVGFTELTPDLRERLPEEYETCSHLLVDGDVYSCGRSLEEAFVRSDLSDSVSSVIRFLQNFEDYERFRERVYQQVADHRTELGKVVWKPPRAREGSERGETRESSERSE